MTLTLTGWLCGQHHLCSGLHPVPFPALCGLVCPRSHCWSCLRPAQRGPQQGRCCAVALMTPACPDGHQPSTRSHSPGWPQAGKQGCSLNPFYLDCRDTTGQPWGGFCGARRSVGVGRQLLHEPAPGPSLAGAARPRGARAEGGCPHSPEPRAAHPLGVPRAAVRGQLPCPYALLHPSGWSCPLKTMSGTVCVSPVVVAGRCTRHGECHHSSGRGVQMPERCHWAALSSRIPQVPPPPTEESSLPDGGGLSWRGGAGQVMCRRWVPEAQMLSAPSPRPWTDRTLATSYLGAGAVTLQ